VATPLPWHRPLPFALYEVRRVYLFAVFFFGPLPCWFFSRVLFPGFAALFIFVVFFLHGTRQSL
jgi:hypothetical protein